MCRGGGRREKERDWKTHTCMGGHGEGERGREIESEELTCVIMEASPF